MAEGEAELQKGHDSVSERRVLELTRAGDPILRKVMPRVAPEDILSAEIQDLINNIRYTCREKQYGVGLAAPQVGAMYALSVIGIKPTPNRPKLEHFDQVIINPSYEGIGEPNGKWEGCMSIGSGDDLLYGQAERFDEIEAEWLDEFGEYHKRILGGFVAHVFQHEADHVNGVLFVDKVRDTTTFMMADEYRKRIVKRES